MRKHLLLLIIVCLCLLISGCGKKTTDPLVWEELYLGNIIPMTNLEKSELGLNYPDSLTITVKNCTKADFDSYLSACEEKGFNVDSRRDGIWHYVYNQKGYRLELCLYSTGDMYIKVVEPLQVEEIGWPTSGLGAQIPTPATNLGVISWNNEDLFCVRIANTSIESYSEYVDVCMKAGFNIDYRRDGRAFTAKNNAGYEVDINYEGFNIIYIAVTPPEETPDAPNTSVIPDTPNTPSTNVDDSTDFKSALDSYEKFFDEYIAFMDKYKDNPYDLAILGEYSKFLEQYSETMNKMSAIDTSSLSADDLAYYFEVTGRIYAKLGDIAG